MLVRILATAVRKFPQFNASIDTERGELIYKKYVNVGVAVDTDRGLLVPVIRNADQKNIAEISIEINQLAAKARDRKLTLEEMSGGGISISNLGGIGGTYFTPIVNWPEVAILGVSRTITEPVWNPRAAGAGNPGSSRVRCCRCRSRTTIASSTAPTRCGSCAGSSRRSSSPSFFHSSADVSLRHTETRGHRIHGYSSVPRASVCRIATG